MPKPRPELADTFRLAGVADAYRARPPYPDEAIELLASLAGGRDARVLDLGAGEGAVARPLASRVTSVHAIEASPAMLRVGRSLPGGGATNLVWSLERAEDLSRPGPFDLVVAGAAMHWFDLDVVCRRLTSVVRPGCPLALCDRSVWHPGLAGVVDVIRRFSRAPEYDPAYDVAHDLTERGLWSLRGRHRTRATTLWQSAEDYLLSLRSTSTLTRELMSTAENDRFDHEVLGLVEPLVGSDGLVALELTSTIVWGELVS